MACCGSAGSGGDACRSSGSSRTRGRPRWGAACRGRGVGVDGVDGGACCGEGVEVAAERSGELR